MQQLALQVSRLLSFAFDVEFLEHIFWLQLFLSSKRFLIFFFSFLLFRRKLIREGILQDILKWLKSGSATSRSSLRPIINYRLITPLSVKCPKQANEGTIKKANVYFFNKRFAFSVCFFFASSRLSYSTPYLHHIFLTLTTLKAH